MQATSIPGSMFLDFLSQIRSEDPATMATSVYDVLKAAVSDEQWDEFKAFIDNPAHGYSVESLLAEIGGYLGEIYSNRPTDRHRSDQPPAGQLGAHLGRVHVGDGQRSTRPSIHLLYEVSYAHLYRLQPEEVHKTRNEIDRTSASWSGQRKGCPAS